MCPRSCPVRMRYPLILHLEEVAPEAGQTCGRVLALDDERLQVVEGFEGVTEYGHRTRLVGSLAC